ncbi:MAG: PrsW family glutamic-type intramembrane protease [Atopobiaceae bacterium]|nr:PrsW family glutamic-type intramembrane protease [Atopobiaceae bacterium]
MILLVLAFAASLVPSLGLFFWLRKLEGDVEFEDICNKAMVQGLISILPVLGCSLVFQIIEMVLAAYAGFSGLPRAAFHTMIVLALSEELVKCLWSRRFMSKYQRAWSWMDYIIVTTIVGIGFGLAEDIPYAIGSSPIVMLIRGIGVAHGGYAFVMGYFMGKGEKTGNKLWTVLGFGLPWLMHGLYDFGLTDEFLSFAGEHGALLSVGLAAFELVVLAILIAFFVRRKDDQRYREPMVALPEAAPATAEQDAPAPLLPTDEGDDDSGHSGRHFA